MLCVCARQVPQNARGYYSSETTQTDMMKTVNSIPAYIERSSHFFVLCPTVQHLDQPDTQCDLASWQGRGWCRVEQAALLLARFTVIPAIIVKGSDAPLSTGSPMEVFSNAPGLGKLTCCARCPSRPSTSPG